MEWQRGDVSSMFILFQILIRGLDVGPEGVERHQTTCARAFGQLDDQLDGRAFICGDALTMADIVIGAMMYRYMTLPIERPDVPRVQADRQCGPPGPWASDG